ncbi:hypothetical protein [Pseudoxanthomonas mexicana]|uniref:hypothetical protein n=1 Tax=Pseudoxanthomonas mexicana TaxID=128785 RepID=UPI00209D6C45|nr:hypothetical protein [Pseudoxanthomonas mexicana]MCP1583780.1 hypothetical protein [Pseudoxanthomonas mexicana]
MTVTRTSHLKDLLHFSRPLADVTHDLSAFAWGPEEELITLEPEHISAILIRFLAGDISDTDVEAWANAIECREDIEFLQPSPIAEVILELANPLLTRPLTRQSAGELVATLHGAAA